MSRFFIVPYNMGSESAKLLAAAVPTRRSKGDKKFRWDTTVVNWGNSSVNLRGHRIRVINKPEAVRIASNKLLTFQRLKQYGVPTVEWTTNKLDAARWVDEDTVVYARHQLSASSGKGIEIVGADDMMPNAPLYTKGFNKSHEYRVHVFRGKVIDFTKKRRRDGTDNNPWIKNHSNGWVFCRDGVALPNKVKLASVLAQQALGLDFGAIDILYRERDDRACILEVNTAPGLEGTTLQKYTEEIKKVMNET